MSTNIKNDPSRAGQKAARHTLHGMTSRWALSPIHTRFDAVAWFVEDAIQWDEVTDRPAVVGIFNTREEALAWLAPQVAEEEAEMQAEWEAEQARLGGVV